MLTMPLFIEIKKAQTESQANFFLRNGILILTRILLFTNINGKFEHIYISFWSYKGFFQRQMVVNLFNP